MRAGEPETKTPAPNTGLNPPLNPNSLMPLTLTVGLLLPAAAAAAGAAAAASGSPKSLRWPEPSRRRSESLRRFSSTSRLALHLE